MTAPESNPTPALQDRYAPHNACFGCGPTNPRGLRLKSRVATGDGAGEGAGEIVAEFFPEDHHQAFPGVLNGGIIGTLLDCHSNWTAAYALMRAAGAETPPCTVTADFHVKLRAPTPMDGPLHLVARAVQIQGSRCTVEAELSATGRVTATCLGTFVAVKEGHPAYHRW
jgi:acyl-coenzyme A thioesterase PaaI-like protein